MKLHSPGFEKKLRHAVKKTVRGSRRLKREFRAAGKLRKHYSGSWLIRPALSAGLGVVTWQVVEKTGHPAAGLAAIALWGLFFIFIHAQNLRARLYESVDLPAFSVLPVSEGTVFRWQAQKFFRGTILSLIDFAVGYATLAAILHFSPVQWVGALPLAILTWGITVSLAALCIAHVPQAPYQLVTTLIFFGIAGLVAVQRIFGLNQLVELLDRVAPKVILIVPTGWPGVLFEMLTPERHWPSLVVMLPLAALLWTIRHSLFRLRAGYQFSELLLPEAPDLLPSAEEDVGAATSTGESKPLRVGRTAIEEIVQSRQFLQAPTWHQGGWFERRLWAWLTPRQRSVSEMLFPNGLVISAGWKKMFRNFCITIVLGLAIGLVSPLWKQIVIGLGIFASFVLVLARVIETGRAFQAVFWSGVNIPFYTGFPTTLRELSGILLKVSAIQFPALLIWSTVSGVLIAHLSGMTLPAGMMHGLRAACLLFAARFVFLVFNFSSGTNDSARFHFRSVALLMVMIVFGASFLVLGGIGLALPRLAAGWALTGLAMLDAYVFFQVYAFFYNRFRFDLMSLPRK